MQKPHLYFAYGSNLCETQMQRRCPESELVGHAILHDFEVFVSHFSPKWDGGVYSIRPKAENKLIGKVYRLSDEDLASLDGFERFPKVYERVSKQVKLFPIDDRDPHHTECVVYISQKIELGIEVSETYEEHCQQALEAIPL